MVQAALDIIGVGRSQDRLRKIFPEKLWGSHFVVLIREMDARAALPEGRTGCVCARDNKQIRSPYDHPRS